MSTTTGAGSTIAICASLPSAETEAGYSALTFTEIGQVEKIGSMGAVYAKTEFQPLFGPKQKHKGAADYGSLSPSLAHDESDPGQAILRAAADSPNLFAFRVIYPTGAKRFFQGKVFGYPETVDGADALLMVAPTIEINSVIVKVAATGAIVLPSVSLSGALSKSEGNSGTVAYTYIVTLSQAAPVGGTAVPWALAYGSTDASDFASGQATSGTLTIAQGQLSGTVTINVNGDTSLEGDETFTFLISTPPGYIAGATTSATGTILNDDSPAAPVFTSQPSISPTTGTAGTTTFTATDGVATNSTSITRRWLLGTTAIGTGLTVVAPSSGSLTLENTAAGPGGSKTVTSTAVTVSAAAPTPTPSAGDTAPQALSTTGDGFGLSTFVVPGYANVGQPYSLLPARKGGAYKGAQTWTLASGTLPSGWALNASTGEITGTPTAAGQISGLKLQVSDSTGTAQTEVFTINVGAAPTVLNPSGDTTGATDVAQFNAITSAGGSVKMGDGAWYQNGPFLTYSNQAVYLPSSGSSFLVNNANCNMMKNANQGSRTRTDKNVSIVGPAVAGNFLFNGNGGGQVRQSNQRLNQELVFISAENYALRGFRVRGNASAVHFLGCYRMQLFNWYADQTVYTNNSNQDGFDLGNGSSFIQCERNVGGQVIDDAHSYYAKASQSGTAMMAGTPWETGADVTDIIVNTTSTGCNLNNMFRLQAGDGFKFLRFFAEDADNTTGGTDKRLIQFGESTYLAARGVPADMADIYVRGSAKLFNRLIAADSNFSKVTLKNLVINKVLTTIISTPDTAGVQYNNITIDGLTESNGPLAHANGFSATRASSVISAITLKNWSLGSMTALFNSTVTGGIQGVVMDSIALASGTTTVASSPTSTGTMHAVTAAGAAVSPGSSGLVTT